MEKLILIIKNIISQPIVFFSAATVSGTITIIEQLNNTYPFLYMHLPLWVFFLLAIIACLIGTLAALLTDVLENEKNTIKKLFLAFSTGITSTFIILPSVIEYPTMGMFLLTALGSSFGGTIIIFILAQVLKDKEFQKSIKNIISKSIIYTFKKIEGFVDYVLGNKKNDDNDTNNIK